MMPMRFQTQTRIENSLQRNGSLPVRALAKSSSPNQPTSRVITRARIANRKPTPNSPRHEIRHRPRDAAKNTIFKNDRTASQSPVGSKSQEAITRQPIPNSSTEQKHRAS